MGGSGIGPGRRPMSWPSLVLLLALGCGGDAAAPTPAVPAPAAGRVMMANQTPYPVEVAYLDGEGRIVRTEVAPGGVGEVSGGLLAGGSEWTFDLVLLLPSEQGYRVRRKATVMVAGDVRLQAALADPQDPFSLEFGPAGD